MIKPLTCIYGYPVVPIVVCFIRYCSKLLYCIEFLIPTEPVHEIEVRLILRAFSLRPRLVTLM